MGLLQSNWWQWYLAGRTTVQQGMIRHIPSQYINGLAKSTLRIYTVCSIKIKYANLYNLVRFIKSLSQSRLRLPTSILFLTWLDMFLALITPLHGKSSWPGVPSFIVSPYQKLNISSDGRILPYWSKLIMLQHYTIALYICNHILTYPVIQGHTTAYAIAHLTVVLYLVCSWCWISWFTSFYHVMGCNHSTRHHRY